MIALISFISMLLNMNIYIEADKPFNLLLAVISLAVFCLESRKYRNFEEGR